jgi:hypothetical protein
MIVIVALLSGIVTALVLNAFKQEDETRELKSRVEQLEKNKLP